MEKLNETKKEKYYGIGLERIVFEIGLEIIAPDTATLQEFRNAPNYGRYMGNSVSLIAAVFREVMPKKRHTILRPRYYGEAVNHGYNFCLAKLEENFAALGVELKEE